MKRIKYDLLPVDLVSKIDEIGFTTIQRYHAIRFISRLLSFQRIHKVSVYDFYEMPANYIVSAYKSKIYKKVIEPLKHNGIIDIKKNKAGVESFEPGRCKAYRVNPELLVAKFKKVSWKQKGDPEDDKYIFIHNERCEKLIVENDIASLIVDSRKLIEATELHISTIAETLVINSEVKMNSFFVRNLNSGYKGFTSLERCLEICKWQGKSLIRDGGKFYVDDVDNYIAHKEKDIKYSYSVAIESLEQGIYHVNRNATNRRLDYILTNISSKLLEVIKTDNNLTEIDLKNSQFAILAYQMENDASFIPDAFFYTFRQEAAAGTLYTYIQNAFNFSSRDDAKMMMMLLAFSSHVSHSKEKKMLRELFPSVVKYIDDYKERKVKEEGKGGHKKFAVMLQEAESKIFIDNIYYNLKVKQGLWLLTKHDSLIVQAKDELYVREYLINYFKSINFHCSLK